MAKTLKDFIERIDIEQDKLRKQRVLLEQATENPELFFDKASETIGRKESLFNIMNVYEDGQRKMDSIELTEYIGKLLENFLREELDDQNIEVKLSSYPSLYCVSMDSTQLVHFDPYDKFFGQRKYRTAQQLQEDYESTLVQIDEEIVETNNKLEDMRKAKESVYKYVFSFYFKKRKNVLKKIKGIAKELTIYVLKKKQIEEGINKKIKQYEHQFEEHNKRKSKHIENGTGIEFLELKLQAVDLVSQVFKKFGYRLETENHRLY